MKSKWWDELKWLMDNKDQLTADENVVVNKLRSTLLATRGTVLIMCYGSPWMYLERDIDAMRAVYERHALSTSTPRPKER